MQAPIGKQSHLFWTPFFFVFYKEVCRFKSVFVETVLGPVISTALYIVVFGMAMAPQLNGPNSLPYIAFLLPGLIMMSCLNQSFHGTTAAFVTAKYTGEIEDYARLPINFNQLLIGLVLGGWLRGMIVSLFNLAIGSLAYYYLYQSWIPLQHPFLLLLFLSLGGLAFSCLGAAIGVWAQSHEHISAIGIFILTPLIFLGGVFFSIEKFSPFWQTVSTLNPIFYMINGTRYSFLGLSDVPMLICIAVSTLFVVAIYSVAYYICSKADFQRW